MKKNRKPMYLVSTCLAWIAGTLLLVAGNGSQHNRTPENIRREDRLEIRTKSGQPEKLIYQTDEFMHRSLQNSVNTATYDTAWTRFAGLSGKDDVYAALQTNDGGYVMAGKTESWGAGNFDGWMAKYNADGVLLWNKTFGASYIDEVYQVKQTQDGGFILAGMTTAFGNAGEGWLIRTNSQGNTLWNKSFHPAVGNSPSAWDYLYDVVETADGGFVAVGYAAMDTNMIQAWILKVNNDGALQWGNTFGGEYWDRLFSLKLTSDGGFVAGGDKHVTHNDTVYKHDGWLVKFNSSGDTLWTRSFGDNEHDIFRCVSPISGGGYILSGERQLTEADGYRMWLVKTNENGDEIWSNVYNHGVFSSVLQSEDHSFMAAGTTTSASTSYEGFMMKTDQAGTELFQYVLSATPLDDMFQSIRPTNDGGYILGGKYNSHMTGGDGWLVKLMPAAPAPLLYFFENFDSVSTPVLPDGWAAKVNVLLSNTAAEIKTMNMGVAPSQPNAVFIMNGIDGSNGQLDSNAFVALITPYVTVTPIGAKITFRGNSGSPILVGTMANPNDPASFILHDSIQLDYNFTEHTVYFFTPGNTYIALVHANNSTVNPIFLDEIEFEQLVNVGLDEHPDIRLTVQPNPAQSVVCLDAPKEIQHFELFDLSGKCVLSQSIRSSHADIRVSQLPAGSYIAKISFADGQIMTRKLVRLP